MTRSAANLLLLLAGAIWGMGFVAQQTAMEDMGPMLFIGFRFLLAGCALLPFVGRELATGRQRVTRARMRRFTLLGSVFFAGMALQQIGLLGTTVTNAGFLTTLYVVLVPLFLLTVVRQRPANFVWPATALSLAGIYCLSFRGLTTVAWGDWFILSCAAVWAVHVILVGRFAQESSLPVTMTCVQFFVCGALGLIFHVGVTLAGWESKPLDAELLWAAMPEVVYAGVFSGALAFTLQAIGQRYTTPSIAAILMASESLFAALFGALFLEERLLGTGYLGCGLIFFAIVLVEVMQAHKNTPSETKAWRPMNPPMPVRLALQPPGALMVTL